MSVNNEKENKKTVCCCGEAGCCSSQDEIKQLVIDFLYLDLSVCERCQGADTNLDGAIKDVSAVLDAAGYKVVINKVNIDSVGLAVEYEFESSPTIRINGKDIALEVKETQCKECGDLCNESVDCRVWTYKGVEYTEPPKEMIVNAILREVYSNDITSPVKNVKYELPENLARFFAALNRK
ncbi:MAG: DUF2703 domain-containing protein [Saccharofermentanales bacterium]